MSLKHNKKRNVGLLSEFFSHYIAKTIIDHKDKETEIAKNIYKKYFSKGTELYKEHKLFNILYKTKLKNKETAISLLAQIKENCKFQSQQKIDLEKTALLHEINSVIKDNNFFNSEISDYKICATIQVLLNNWRNINNSLLSENIGEQSQLEDKIIEHICLTETTEKKPLVENVLSMTDKDVNQLVANIMLEKLNNKFGKTLTDEQRKIINLYMFCNESNEDKQKLFSILEEIKDRSLSAITTELQQIKDEEIKVKLNEIKDLLRNDYYGNLSSNLEDDKISFYLSILKLEKELKDNVSS